jgi:hypothetical protein
MAEDRTQANILVKGCEADKIETKGRCFARLPGQNKITELQTPYISERQIAAIAPHIQGKGSVTAPNIGSTITTTPPLSFVVGPEPEPTTEEMAIIEAVKQVELERGKIVWSAVTTSLGWVTSGANNQRIKAVLDKWEINY